MNFLKHIFKKHAIFSLIVLAFLMLVGFIQVFAIGPNYDIGETLDPSEAPGTSSVRFFSSGDADEVLTKTSGGVSWQTPDEYHDIYRAQLTRSGDNLIVSVYENTIGNITWAVGDQDAGEEGDYFYGHLIDGFPEGRTIFPPFDETNIFGPMLPVKLADAFYKVERVDDDKFIVRFADINGNPVGFDGFSGSLDDVKILVEILVYPE